MSGKSMSGRLRFQESQMSLYLSILVFNGLYRFSMVYIGIHWSSKMIINLIDGGR